MGTPYIAFLRAINVGGHIVKMDELKKIFEAAKLRDVETFIASGNVIFTSAAKNSTKLEMQIEAALQKALGYTVATMLRTVPEVTDVAHYEPFSAEALGSASLYVGFMQVVPTKDAAKKVLALATAVDDLHLRGREIYWLARQNIQHSTISAAAIEKGLQTPVTFRNMNTLRRLLQKTQKRQKQRS